MRNNTPPTSPYRNDEFDEEIDDDDDEELIYVGDADEVIDDLDEHLNRIRREQNNDFDEDDEDVELMGTASGGGLDELENMIPERDDAKLTFKQHTGSVFCCALHPTDNLAVTGGEDDKAFVWNIETGEILFEIQDHKDSVVACGFSHDGVYLATADMAGFIQVFKVTQNYKKVWEFLMGDLCWMQWHQFAYVLLAGSESGEVYIWRIPSGDCKVLQGFGEKCEAAQLSSDGKKLAAGYGDGSFKLWDIRSCSSILDVKSDDTMGHSQNITCIAIDRENNLILTGSEDGKAVLMRQTGPIGNLVSDNSPIEAVLLDNNEFEIKVGIVGTLDGKVSVWDIAKQTMRVECDDPQPSGITRLLWGTNCTIIAGALGGAIKVWDLRSGQLKYQLLGHVSDIQNLVFDKNRNILLSVSDDKTAKIFSLPT
uniref:Putative angio-associated migratory cell protein n=1 Tax=Corethrella appendiculata TaxID=1370023 RepID=U5EVG7_9DIPT